MIMHSPCDGWEVIPDGRARAREAKDAKIGRAIGQVNVEEGDAFPCRRGDGDKDEENGGCEAEEETRESSACGHCVLRWTSERGERGINDREWWVESCPARFLYASADRLCLSLRLLRHSASETLPRFRHPITIARDCATKRAAVRRANIAHEAALASPCWVFFQCPFWCSVHAQLHGHPVAQPSTLIVRPRKRLLLTRSFHSCAAIWARAIQLCFTWHFLKRSVHVSVLQ